jgi:hypothetical protein
VAVDEVLEEKVFLPIRSKAKVLPPYNHRTKSTELIVSWRDVVAESSSSFPWLPYLVVTEPVSLSIQLRNFHTYLLP